MSKEKPAALKPADSLSFLKKAQIVMGFDMDIETGALAPLNYDGNFILNNHISGAGKAQVLDFLKDEGITPLPVAGKKVVLSAEDYYRLEEKYDIPVKAEDIRQLHRRFAGTRSADFINSNSAFGMNYSRAIKLLRENGIEGTVQLLDTKQSAGDQSDRPVIELTGPGYEAFTSRLPEIIEAQTRKLSAYQEQVAARAAHRK